MSEVTLQTPAPVAQLDEAALDLLWRKARSHKAWREVPVPRALLQQVVELAQAGPTATNSQPMRIVWVVSAQAKQRLRPAPHAGNVAKMMSAPVTAIVAHDLEFHAHQARTFPHRDVASGYRADTAHAHDTALRNSTLQGAYLMLSARALGLDIGPMSGLHNDAVDAEFFAGTSLRSNFLCNLGYADHADLLPRQPRLGFDEICSWA
jgi:3-hydroxypropanoate dehydrogenase